jgi:hypothetical protein
VPPTGEIMAGNPHPRICFHVVTLYRLHNDKSERAMLKPWAIPVRDRIFSDYVARRLQRTAPHAAAVRGRISAPRNAPPPPIRTVSDDPPFASLVPIKKGRWKRWGREQAFLGCEPWREEGLYRGEERV